jgi:hypothetical protein
MRETDDLKDEFLEEHITPEIYQILFGRDQAKDQVLESAEWA